MLPELGEAQWPTSTASFYPRVDVSAIASLDDLESIIARDFGGKAPTARQIGERIAGGDYNSRFELLRDATRYLYWAHRYFLALYVLRPSRWEDLPTGDHDARLAAVVAGDTDQQLMGLINAAFSELHAGWPGNTEQTVLNMLREPLASVTYDPAELTAVLPPVATAADNGDCLAMCVRGPRPVGAHVAHRDVLDQADSVPELTALLRQASVIASEHVGRWGRPEMKRFDGLSGADFVLIAWPRSDAVAQLVAGGRPNPSMQTPPKRPVSTPTGREGLVYRPSRGVRIVGLTAVKGEVRITNDDIVANAAWHWSPMTAADIFDRTGILERRYTHYTLDELASAATIQLLAQTEDLAEDICAVVVCSSTNSMPIPSFAARVADAAGLGDLDGVWDVAAACAGFPYGLAQASRLVEDTRCPVLLVFAEKFSDKVGTVRTSRMLFADGASAMLLAPATDGRGDVELIRTYAGGSSAEVYAAQWPHPSFNDDLAVDGDRARMIVERYMERMLADLAAHQSPTAVLDDVDLVITHQANERLVREIAGATGIPEALLYFNVSHLGNTSSASIPIALHDAISDGTIPEQARVLTPAYAAGALAGIALLTARAAIVRRVKGTVPP